MQEVLLSRDGSRICGLALEGGGILQPRRTLDYQAVRIVEETHIIADEVFLASDGEARCREELQGLPVLNGEGAEVGLLDDFHFDPNTGRITALQLSHGFVDDLLRGKETLPLGGPVVTGESVIMLDGPGESAGGAE